MMIRLLSRQQKNNHAPSLLIFACVLAGCLFSRPVAQGSGSEHYQYLSRTGKTSLTVDWRLEKCRDVSLTYETTEELSVTITDHEYRTVRWEYQNVANRTDVIARRNGNRIHVAGTFKGKPIERNLSIDDAPWYQAISLSLRPFVLSDQREVKFWALRPGAMTAHELMAEKRAVVTLPVMDKITPVQEVKIGLPGALSPFWNASCWYDVQNGRFIRYEGPTGPPGSPVMVLDLTRTMPAQ